MANQRAEESERRAEERVQSVRTRIYRLLGCFLFSFCFYFKIERETDEDDNERGREKARRLH